MSSPWTATIKSDRTQDGRFVLHPASPFKVGVEIEIDLDTKGIRKMKVKSTQEAFESEVIFTTDGKNFFPTEMLEL
jgi:hypothetical protein